VIASASGTIELDALHGMGNYARRPITFVRGEGARLWDDGGREYIDFLAGIAVCGLGHAHPKVARAVANQAAQLVHISNLYHHPLQPMLAQRLCAATGLDRVFFCNSGTEANEAAIKLARLWGHTEKGRDSHRIVTVTGSFHGRTLGSLAATAQPKLHQGFEPLPGGFVYVTRNAGGALEKAVGDDTCAVFLEPIQGEGGVHELEGEFLLLAQRLCRERGALLMLDEVQTGIGRTGTFLAAQQLGLEPDVVTLAKGIANGVPMGACLARGRAAEILKPGTHGSTFGGNPLACAAALAVLDVLESEGLPQRAADTGKFLRGLLEDLALLVPDTILEVRGRGLMIGVEFTRPIAGQVIGAMLEKGLVCGGSGDSVLRLLPPLVVSQAECGVLVQALASVLDSLR
jgi:acetylornithine/N-succinyldiaminopimelate aminotransferase